jgi:hypothetical protein
MPRCTACQADGKSPHPLIRRVATSEPPTTASRCISVACTTPQCQHTGHTTAYTNIKCNYGATVMLSSPAVVTTAAATPSTPAAKSSTPATICFEPWHICPLWADLRVVHSCSARQDCRAYHVMLLDSCC